MLRFLGENVWNIHIYVCTVGQVFKTNAHTHMYMLYNYKMGMTMEYYVRFFVVSIRGRAWMVGSKIRWSARKWRSCQGCKVPSNMHEQELIHQRFVYHILYTPSAWPYRQNPGHMVITLFFWFETICTWMCPNSICAWIFEGNKTRGSIHECIFFHISDFGVAEKRKLYEDLPNSNQRHMWAQVLVSFHFDKTQHRLRCPGIKLHLVFLRDEAHLVSEELDPCITAVGWDKLTKPEGT